MLIKKYTPFLLMIAFVAACKSTQPSQVAVNTPVITLPIDTVSSPEDTLYSDILGESLESDLESSDAHPVNLPDTLPTYRKTAQLVFDLIHTTLWVSFDMPKKHLIGKAEITAAPYAEPTRFFALDAQGFDIHSVKWSDNKTAIPFTYDNKILTLDLGKEMPVGKPFKIMIDYTAKPDDLPVSGSAAITADKGLYFINPEGTDPNKPTQIWTQGETQSNSKWFPTIDKPNQRLTQEMYITVKDEYQTLSNGTFLGGKKNKDGTRTDHYKMNLPHAPYLFMMAVGKYAVINDKWNNVPLKYYVEPEFAASAKKIFNHTPEMLTFFSKLLNYKYPWPSFSQVIVRDYVSGAMENTTAVVFGDFIQKDDDALALDNNDNIVAHEMFHHWFGDLVTTESWSNITLNEGFANYSEYLWTEYKYGREAADFHRLNEEATYLQAAHSKMHDLIDFSYTSREDMFDAHSYNKGGLVLHMLRSYLGDTLFFKGLNRYLNEYKFQSVEGHNLRLSMEKVSGQDLNWFFNQWFYGSGQPQISVRDSFSNDKLYLMISQHQAGPQQQYIFQLPVKVDFYMKDQQKPLRQQIFINQRNQTFEFPLNSAPINIIFDADNSLLAEIDYPKPKEKYYYQAYHNSTLYDKIDVLRNLKEETGATFNNIQLKYLNDPAAEVRLLTLYSVDVQSNPDIENKLIAMATKDPSIQVRSSALSILAENPKESYRNMFQTNLNPEGGTVLFGESLYGLYKIDPAKALEIAHANEKTKSKSIRSAILEIFMDAKDPAAFPLLETEIATTDGFESFNIFSKYTELLMKQNESVLRNSVEKLGTYSRSGGSQWRIYSIAKALHDVAVSTDLMQIPSPQLAEIQSSAKKYLNRLIDSQKNSPIYNALENFRQE